jgi:hypothetical protein
MIRPEHDADSLSLWERARVRAFRRCTLTPALSRRERENQLLA